MDTQLGKWTAYYVSHGRDGQRDFDSFEAAMSWLERSMDDGELAPDGVAYDSGPVRPYMDVWPNWFYGPRGPVEQYKKRRPSVGS